MSIHYEEVPIPDGYVLAVAVVCFILAALGIGLLGWMFRDRILPLLPAPQPSFPPHSDKAMVNQSPTPAPNRRWFRWSLRTLFVVVTVLSLWLGWRNYCLAWARDRHQVAKISNEQPWSEPRVVVGSDTGSPPWSLWFFGERGYDRLRVFFPGEPDEDQLTDGQREVLEAIRRAFPEAVVEVVPPYTGQPL